MARKKQQKKASERVIPIAHEEMRVERRVKVTGRLSVHTSVEEQTELARADLAQEDLEVSWIEINRPVQEAPQVRTEGDVLIIPVCEEVLHVEKRLILRREMHVRRDVSKKTFEQPVTLRRTHIEVERKRGNDAAESRGPISKKERL